ncbi:hypothetical protein V6N12_032257 [Hibiscus sabdariffa]|uniref:Uncharacterized protein n=1 Tax=Hibiscus sabdariffa TaxID=183260 RepID=A0ABR2CC17_9ROSI
MYSHLEEPVLGRYSPKGSQPHNNLFRKMLRKLNEAMQSSRGRLQANLISDQGCLNLAKLKELLASVTLNDIGMNPRNPKGC